MSWNSVIAIDGPSGSGKSTITKTVAQKIGFTYLDTGAMFRSLALFLNRKNINLDVNTISSQDLEKISKELNSMDFSYAPKQGVLIEINGSDYTWDIRAHEVSKLASMVSKINIVRDFLATLQRRVADGKNCILEGRDIGTVIFPNAALKIFLTASSEVRAKRRLSELNAKGEKGHELVQIQKDIERRDFEDSNRDIAPLLKADDAIEIDTSTLSIEEVCNQILAQYQKVKSRFS